MKFSQNIERKRMTLAFFLRWCGAVCREGLLVVPYRKKGGSDFYPGTELPVAKGPIATEMGGTWLNVEISNLKGPRWTAKGRTGGVGFWEPASNTRCAVRK